MRAPCEHIGPAMASADLSSPRGRTRYPSALLEPWPRSGPPRVSSARTHTRISDAVRAPCEYPPFTVWEVLRADPTLQPCPAADAGGCAVRGLPTLHSRTHCNSHLHTHVTQCPDDGLHPSICVSIGGIAWARFMALPLPSCHPALLTVVSPLRPTAFSTPKPPPPLPESLTSQDAQRVRPGSAPRQRTG